MERSGGGPVTGGGPGQVQGGSLTFSHKLKADCLQSVILHQQLHVTQELVKNAHSQALQWTC